MTTNTRLKVRLPDTVQGSIKRPLVLTWKDDDEVAINLTGATLTGYVKPAGGGGVRRSITGVLAAVTPTDGIFSWTRSAADVGTPGEFEVQIVATYPGALPEVSYSADWTVLEAL